LYVFLHFGKIINKMPISEGAAIQEKKVIFRAYQIIWYVLGILETLLIFRFVLKLTAANPSSPFSILVYGLTYPFILPFRWLYSTPSFEGSQVEWHTIIAMFVYFLASWFLIRFFQLVKPVKKSEIEETVDNV